MIPTCSGYRDYVRGRCLFAVEAGVDHGVGVTLLRYVVDDPTNNRWVQDVADTVIFLDSLAPYAYRPRIGTRGVRGLRLACGQPEPSARGSRSCQRLCVEVIENEVPLRPPVGGEAGAAPLAQLRVQRSCDTVA